MSALTNSFETSLLNLIFINLDIANIGDAAGLQNSAAAGSLYISLHTASPGEAGSQTTNEASYTNYARVAVARSAAGWTVTANEVTNDADITFPQSGSSQTLTHWGVGTDSSGAGTLLFHGVLDASMSIVNNATPVITTLAISAD